MPERVGIVTFKNDTVDNIRVMTLLHRRNNDPKKEEQKTLFGISAGNTMYSVFQFTYETDQDAAQDYWGFHIITDTGSVYTIKNNLCCPLREEDWDDPRVLLSVKDIDDQKKAFWIVFTGSHSCRIEIKSPEASEPIPYRSSPDRRDLNYNPHYPPVMIQDWIGPPDGYSEFQLGKYNPDFWSVPYKNNNWALYNNCYAYACNIRVDNAFPHPGFKKYKRPPHDRAELLDGINVDGLVKITDSIAEKIVRGTYSNPAWIVALCDGNTPNSDPEEYFYHFYRKVWSGVGTGCGSNSEQCFFSSKIGSDPVTNTIKNSSSKIINPLDDMHARGLRFIGFYLVPPDITIYAPAYP